jgi:hypothetical protein
MTIAPAPRKAEDSAFEQLKSVVNSVQAKKRMIRVEDTKEYQDCMDVCQSPEYAVDLLTEMLKGSRELCHEFLKAERTVVNQCCIPSTWVEAKPWE